MVSHDDFFPQKKQGLVKQQFSIFKKTILSILKNEDYSSAIFPVITFKVLLYNSYSDFCCSIFEFIVLMTKKFQVFIFFSKFLEVIKTERNISYLCFIRGLCEYV